MDPLHVSRTLHRREWLVPIVSSTIGSWLNALLGMQEMTEATATMASGMVTKRQIALPQSDGGQR